MMKNEEMEDMIELNREMSEVKTMLGMLIKAVDELKSTISTNYVPRTELEERFKAQGERIGKLERHISTVAMTVISIVLAGIIGFVYFNK